MKKQSSKAHCKSFLVSSTGAKVIELAGIVVVVLLFLVLFFLNRSKFAAPASSSEKSAVTVPYAQPYHVVAILTNAGFPLEGTAPDFTDPSGWSCTSESDEGGIVMLSLSAPLMADLPDDGSFLTVATCNAQNQAFRSRLEALLKDLLPVFDGNASDISQIMQTISSSLSAQKAKTTSFGRYSLQLIPEKDHLLLNLQRSSDKK